jgi:WhiB family transcriptional regulator, redox-sensing transcriptional regulator
VLVRSVPLEGGACPPPEAADPAARASVVATTSDSTALGTLLDAAPRAGLDLPCRSGDADLWFAESPAELERAKALCAECPIRAACLAGALDREEPWGVWGGEIFERGVVVPRKRPRGRPSKADLARDRAYAAAAAAAALSA